MNESNKPTLKRIFGYKIFFVVNVIVLALLGLSFGREFVRSASISREISALQDEKAKLEAKTLSLGAYKEYLETESFLEKEAREKFGLQRPGETQVYIDEVGAPLDASSVADLYGGENEPTEIWRLWLWYFFDPDIFDTYEST